MPKAQEAERLVGATVYLDLAELGAEGPAEVVSVEPCPAIGPPPAEGCRMVTGTFAHAAGNVVDLTVEGLDEPIGTTANHPFWSEDRRAFIPAGELRQGETLHTAAGDPRRVARIAARRTTEPVHNLEVDAEHVYYVSSDGLLVHNSCSVIGRPHGIPKHKARVSSLARELKAKGEYTKIYINKSLRRITGGKVNDLRRPDIVGVRKDGTLDLFEVPHPKQTSRSDTGSELNGT